VQPVPRVTFEELERRHRAIFLDAYGVLVDGVGALPGAPELVARLEARGTPYAIVTNDASRLPETMEARFTGLGLPIPRSRIVSSGDLVARYVDDHGLGGARAVVLGPRDSHAIVARAGLSVVPATPDQDFDALFVCDESGFDLLPTMDDVLSMLVRAFDRGRSPRLVAPNPDLVYPKRAGEWGFAGGTLASMLEGALAQRYATPPTFARLGKPHAPIFEEACRRVGTRDAVMVGDQIHTDIQGASDFGLASALLGSGIADVEEALRAGARPTYVLTSIR